MRYGTSKGSPKGKSQARERDRIQPVDDATIEATLTELDETVVAMVRLQRFTGMRPGEVCQLRPCDIDRSGGDVWFYRPATHKTEHHGVDRVIVIGPQAQDVLRPFLLRPETSNCFQPTRSHRDFYTKDSYRMRIWKACRRAGVKRWSPNQLRHTAATEVRKRFGLEAAQVALGHTTANVTQVYAEWDWTRQSKLHGLWAKFEAFSRG